MPHALPRPDMAGLYGVAKGREKMSIVEIARLEMLASRVWLYPSVT
jgi:hypothetical protein